MGSCDIPDTDPLNKPCNPVTTPTVTPNTACKTTITGLNCVDEPLCSPWDMASETSDSCYVSAVSAELLAISGANINVHKLLGVHEQGKLLDQTGNGNAISSGDIPNYPATNAFDKYITEWRSIQLGSDVLRSAFIGYDFGPIRLPNGRERYGIETFVRRDVATIQLKQGCNPQNRATKIRLERSSDGIKWYGVSIAAAPDCDGLVTINFKKSVPSRWWRIRPVVFNGGANDFWIVQALRLMDYEETAVDNIQDRVFLENRDRDYSSTPITIKGSYAPLEVQTFQSKFGNSSLFGGSETYSIEVNFAQTIAQLGRPLVVGDILQLDSETQYTPTLDPVLKFLEVTNITWSVNGYTANWKPTLQRILAEPALASQETQDIFGDLTEKIDSSGLIDINDSSPGRAYQDIMNTSDTVAANANSQVPERGTDYAGVTKINKTDPWVRSHTNFDTQKIDRHRNIFGIDALPPNGLPFTEGDDFPDAPKDGDYHRLTYVKLADNIPPRLNRWSASKKRWIYMETDRRFAMKNSMPVLQEFLDPTSSSVTKPQDTKDTF
jgi:hypothetical protein